VLVQVFPSHDASSTVPPIRTGSPISPRLCNRCPTSCGKQTRDVLQDNSREQIRAHTCVYSSLKVEIKFPVPKGRAGRVIHSAWVLPLGHITSRGSIPKRVLWPKWSHTVYMKAYMNDCPTLSFVASCEAACSRFAHPTGSRCIRWGWASTSPTSYHVGYPCAAMALDNWLDGNSHAHAFWASYRSRVIGAGAHVDGCQLGARGSRDFRAGNTRECPHGSGSSKPSAVLENWGFPLRHVLVMRLCGSCQEMTPGGPSFSGFRWWRGITRSPHSRSHGTNSNNINTQHLTYGQSLTIHCTTMEHLEGTRYRHFKPDTATTSRRQLVNR